jgi:AcrR family transcriptional regulator
MRRTQAVALDLFERDGYDAVGIDTIAAAAEVGPATIYRNFGTKERLVLWDEYDPMLLEAVTAELADHAVLEALPRALSRAVGEVYTRDRVRILRRARLIRANVALQQVAAGDARMLRVALAEVFRSSRHAADPFEAVIWAGAVVSTLEAAVDRWVDGDGEGSLARQFAGAFRRLGRLSAA